MLSTQVQACNLVADLADRDHYVGLLLYKCKQELKPQAHCFFYEDEVQLSATRAHTTLLSVSEVAALIGAVQQYLTMEASCMCTGEQMVFYCRENVAPQMKRFIL